MYDPTPEKLEELESSTQEAAYWLIRVAREAGIPMMIISGFRSPDLNRQVGGAPNSLHLHGMAFDVQVSGFTREQLPKEWWAAVGSYAEQVLGLRWGGRFVIPDVNHFDLG